MPGKWFAPFPQKEFVTWSRFYAMNKPADRLLFKLLEVIDNKISESNEYLLKQKI
jgi:hypothetical protein